MPFLRVLRGAVFPGGPSVCMIWGKPPIGTSLSGKYKMYISRECKRKLVAYQSSYKLVSF